MSKHPSVPRPQPPREPELSDCCGSGCNPCIFDIYQDRLERYRAELEAWEVAHARPRRRGKSPKPAPE